MKRDKVWWARLSKEERSRLVWLERASNEIASGSVYLPEDAVECPACGCPSLAGFCTHCADDLEALLMKANNGLVSGARMYR